MNILLGILVFLVIIMILYGFLGNFFLKTENYELISEKITKNYTIALLSDLHGCEHGKNNTKLLREIEQAKPDLICISGDMTVKTGKNTEKMITLLATLAQKYPVYYAPGNHEIRMPFYEEFKEKIEQMGIHYLENETARPGELSITGLDLDEYWFHKCWEKRHYTVEEMENTVGVCDRGTYRILLAHNPEYFPVYSRWGADVTFSGHVHGGIATLPILGGVIAPSLRLFPKYSNGKYEKEGKYMIVSRGLGLHHIKLRFFNLPELAIVKLTCQEQEK